MKLRTEMIHMDGKWSVGVVGGFSEEAQARARKDVSHDAMAAHALLQAMEEMGSRGTWGKDRAAEILAGWMGDRG